MMNGGLVEGSLPGFIPVGRPEFDVLLVDDERDVLLFTGNYLRSRGYLVLVASDATHAMRQLENKVGLVVLDINLAGEDGLHLMYYLRHNHPEIPIIIYTGLPHDHRQVRAMLKRGAACYVHKTFSILSISEQDLLFAIEKIQERSRTIK